MSRGLRGLAISLALGLGALASCGGASTTAPAAPDRPAATAPGAPADSCITADDCDLVEACCNCNNGGKRIAIRKDAMASFAASRAQRCGGVMCAHHVSLDPSCDAEPICGSGNRCRVAPHMQHQ